MVIPKLKDIAAATGLHEMTVSRALRNVGRMRPETRQRVRETARQMGYRPDAAAAAMRTGHTGCIAMISSPRQHSSHLTPDALAGIIEAVARRGGYLAHAALPGNVDISDAGTLPRVLSRRMAEGLLLNYTHDEPANLDAFLQRYGLPAVWMNNKRRCSAVYPDDYGAARDVTERLLAQGHTRIAFVRLARGDDIPPHAEHYSVADRVGGYEAAMRQAGLLPDVQVYAGQWDQWEEEPDARLQSLARVFCDPARRPTAVILYRDGPVLRVLLQQLGVRVPDDISMVAFSDYASRAAEQMVSGVPIPFEEMGRRAVDMLFELIETGAKELPALALPYGEIASLHTIRRIG